MQILNLVKPYELAGEVTREFIMNEVISSSDLVLSGALILDDENQRIIVNTLQLKDYLEVKDAEDMLNPIMNMFADMAKSSGFELVLISTIVASSSSSCSWSSARSSSSRGARRRRASTSNGRWP